MGAKMKQGFWLLPFQDELSSSVQTGTHLWALWLYGALYSTVQPVQLPQGLLMQYQINIAFIYTPET
jgi:hypothetical protein